MYKLIFKLLFKYQENYKFQINEFQAQINKKNEDYNDLKNNFLQKKM